MNTRPSFHVAVKGKAKEKRAIWGCLVLRGPTTNRNGVVLTRSFGFPFKPARTMGTRKKRRSDLVGP